MSDRIVDLISAWPGEKYKLRFIGTPHRRFRFYHEGGFIDIVDQKKASVLIARGFKGFAEYWGVAMDRDTADICIVEMTHELFSLLVSCSQTVDGSMAGTDGVDVYVEVTALEVPHYVVRLGERTTVTDGVMQVVADTKDELSAEMLNEGADDEIVAMGKEAFRERSVLTPSIIDYEDIEAVESDIESEEWKRILLDFATYVAEAGDDKVAISASHIIKTLRKQG